MIIAYLIQSKIDEFAQVRRQIENSAMVRQVEVQNGIFGAFYSLFCLVTSISAMFLTHHLGTINSEAAINGCENELEIPC